mmetsp:Transcript_21436/g.41600  ORF Transcript_21436/g.41600 Transcript_21436/m.41600 type:complete len:256 (+) Transcript_21436:509-1276(+)
MHTRSRTHTPHTRARTNRGHQHIHARRRLWGASHMSLCNYGSICSIGVFLAHSGPWSRMPRKNGSSVLFGAHGSAARVRHAVVDASVPKRGEEYQRGALLRRHLEPLELGCVKSRVALLRFPVERVEVDDALRQSLAPIGKEQVQPIWVTRRPGIGVYSLELSWAVSRDCGSLEPFLLGTKEHPLRVREERGVRVGRCARPVRGLEGIRAPLGASEASPAPYRPQNLLQGHWYRLDQSCHRKGCEASRRRRRAEG